MQYDDPERPQHEVSGTSYPLHLSGAPMPSVTMIRPMQSEGPPNDEGVRTWLWGWLCCIHAARGKNSFSHYYAWIGDMGSFQLNFLQDPEATLLKHFKWKGLEAEAIAPKQQQQVIEEDIFAEETD